MNEPCVTIHPIKKRASVEYNGMELVLSILLLYENVHNYEDLIQQITEIIKTKYSKIVFNQEDVDFKNYVNDIGKKQKIVDQYIQNFRKVDLTQIIQCDKIKCIYISGKKNKHAIITKLNSTIDKKAAKADIYIEYINDDDDNTKENNTKENKIIGISVKQSKEATKSNYSVHKLLGDELDTILTNIKKTYLKENGFSSFDKTLRDQVNQLFYPQNKENPYWSRIRTEIINNNELIVQQLIESLYCSIVNYDIYEFDGISFTKLNTIIDMSTVVFEEYIPYYFTKSGEERRTAKLFYRLTVGEKIYRVEVRWKGNVYNAAPQFQIHDSQEDTKDE